MCFWSYRQILESNNRQINKKNAYLGSFFIPEKYVIRVLFMSPWTSLTPPLAIRVPPGGVHHLIFRGAWKLGSGNFYLFFPPPMAAKFCFFVFTPQMDEFFLFKNYHFTTEFWGRVDSPPPHFLWQQSFFFFFFLTSTAGEVFFFFFFSKKLPCLLPPGYQMVHPLECRRQALYAGQTIKLNVCSFFKCACQLGPSRPTRYAMT